jgi:hypothetical protein
MVILGNVVLGTVVLGMVVLGMVGVPFQLPTSRGGYIYTVHMGLMASAAKKY